MFISKLTARIHTVSKSAQLLYLQYREHSANSTQQKRVATDKPISYNKRTNAIFHTWHIATSLYQVALNHLQPP